MKKFKNKVKNIQYNTILPDSTLMIFKTKKINILKNVYIELIKHGLKRDQNIIQYSFYINNEENDIGYLTSGGCYNYARHTDNKWCLPSFHI